MKKVISFALALLMILSLAGCGAANKPEKVVSKLFKSIQKLDEEGIEECIHDGDLDLDELLSGAGEDGYMSKEALKYLKKYASSIKFSIGDARYDGDGADVPTTVTYPNIGPVIAEAFGELMKQSFSQLFGGDEMEEDDAEEMFLSILKEKLKDAEIDMKTADVNIRCIQVGDEWKVANLSDVFENMFSNIWDSSLDVFDALGDLVG